MEGGANIPIPQFSKLSIHSHIGYIYVNMLHLGICFTCMPPGGGFNGLEWNEDRQGVIERV